MQQIDKPTTNAARGFQPEVILVVLLALSAAAGVGWLLWGGASPRAGAAAANINSTPDEAATAAESKVFRTDAEWKELLTPQQYEITRRKGTERAFTGEYWDHHEEGVYKCVGCGAELFTSATKFDSHCGWPSFSAPAKQSHVTTQADHSLLFARTEVNCWRCGAHLGHVFDDGPPPTGLRYCINSAALKFEKKPIARATDVDK